MSNKLTNTKTTSIPIRAGLPEDTEWSASHRAEVRQFEKTALSKRTPEQRRKNALMAVLFEIEDYLEQEPGSLKQMRSIESYLKDLLTVLNLPFKHFAHSIDTTDANLKKYVTGDRKFNTDLALKFGFFFHTSPDLWLKLQFKNELIALSHEKKQLSKYKKYSYEKVLAG